ncbi:uncharacterized protein N7477_001602, partial [Penicillium maclennaniae]|uniref:uncharacterized protein n=1 Tax=Penicillium maclennaniae TaxID=1343394 RepID=UPI0025413D33
RPALFPLQYLRRLLCYCSRYYCSFKYQTDPQNAGSDAPTGDEQPISAGLPKDITLAALSQLGVFRTGSNRCFVSIIDGQNQFIISETTKSISLRDKDKHLPGDGVYIGVRALDLVWGVCPHTIKLFTSIDSSNDIDTPNVTANKSRYIIRDFTKEDCFKDRPYVLDWPHMRFYAEVPLFSAAGYVLGSYCVVDDKPRDKFDDEEVAVLQEVSDAIAAHLENVRLVHIQHRAESLMKGLTSFVKENPEFEPTEASRDGHLVPSALNIPGYMSTGSGGSGNEFFGAHPGGQSAYNVSMLDDMSSAVLETSSPLFSQEKVSRPTDPSSFSTSSDRPNVLSPAEEKSLEEALKVREVSPSATEARRKTSARVSLMDSVSIAERIAMVFDRASVLLRESMDLDGVVFLDASHSNSSFKSPREPKSWEPFPYTADNGIRVAPPPSPFGLAQPEKPCDILSFALKPPSNNTQADCDLQVPEKLLHELTIAYPRGQIFSFEERVVDDHLSHGGDRSIKLGVGFEAAQNISDRLAQCMPDAESHQRTLEIEEVHFFKVFADSIISEISRLHWATTEKSKFDFISSINHELRSPLHGILASTELLHATNLLPSQDDIVRMIEQSGMNLLDTTDHLLDFCKINNSSLMRKSRPANAGENPAGLASDFALDTLVEEVANIIYTGQRALARGIGLRQTYSSSEANGESPQRVSSEMDKLSVVIRIEKAYDWNIRSVAGVWRRIVMNLLGNALKWTKKGFVEVSLSKAQHHSCPGSLLAHLSVIDTGSGIAPDYLKSHLFTPFSQEDSLSEGVGLGLSIVRQLVTSLGGNITLKSEQDVGTQADVYLPIQCLESTPEQSSGDTLLESQNPTTHIHACLVGFNAYPDLQEIPTGILSAEAKRKLSIQSTLADVFTTQLGWAISLAETLQDGRGDVVVVEEDCVESLSDLDHKCDSKFFVILSGKVPTLGDHLPLNVIRVSQPFGPQKIHQAAQKILKLHAEQRTALSAGAIPGVPPIELSAHPVSEGVSTLVPIDGKINPLGDNSGSAVQTTLSFQPAVDHNGIHVLIVDDNEINLKIMATFMQKSGCSYETASNGLIALEKYSTSSRRFNFILMDLSMPVMDGIVSTNKIRQYENEACLERCRIMAVTGVASAPMKQQAFAAGINDYLIKPLSLRQLKTLMNIA